MTTVFLCNLTGLGQREGSQQLPITTLLPYHLPPKLPSGEITQLHFSRSLNLPTPSLSVPPWVWGRASESILDPQARQN